MVSAGRRRGFGSDPPTESGRARLGGRHSSLEYGFRINESEKCLYYKENIGGCVILCLYVDDILIFGTDLEIVKEVKSYLSKKFDMKDLGEAKVILGMEIEKIGSGISLSQSNTIDKMLKKFKFYDSQPVSKPYDPHIHLKKSKGDPISQLKYSQMIGSLLYLTNKLDHISLMLWED